MTFGRSETIESLDASDDRWQSLPEMGIVQPVTLFKLFKIAYINYLNHQIEPEDLGIHLQHGEFQGEILVS